MRNVVVLEHARAEDPEVVNVRQPIDNTDLLFFVLDRRVDDHVLPCEQDPVPLNHDLYIGHLDATVNVEDTAGLRVVDSFKQELEKSFLVTRRH